jgi:hypothetical protein
MTADGIDPENPRPKGHYPRFAANEWHYVPDELAQTISLGPAGDGEPGQDWVLTYTPERRNEADREKVLVSAYSSGASRTVYRNERPLAGRSTGRTHRRVRALRRTGTVR